MAVARRPHTLPAKNTVGFVYELIHYKTETAAKTPSIHAAQGGVNERIDRKKPAYPADIYRRPTRQRRSGLAARLRRRIDAPYVEQNACATTCARKHPWIDDRRQIYTAVAAVDITLGLT